jgi:hypothetical protein
MCSRDASFSERLYVVNNLINQTRVSIYFKHAVYFILLHSTRCKTFETNSPVEKIDLQLSDFESCTGVRKALGNLKKKKLVM